ncbi:Ppx/GppA phosphatase family protein [Aeromicrobium halocynthiae]|uniref:Ppx/GppA phosphatase family protein n=1 Tax=Aeromicrobium halocynthiae TaxID=560557 RepID=A0ABN2VX33_9ACTN
MPEIRRVAAIDCGTNSLRLLISDVGPDRKDDVVREMRVVRLGQDVDRTGRFADEAVQRTLQVTREYGELIAMLDARTVRFCATSAARDAENGDELLEGVRSVLGVDVEILSGEDEAAASFLGATQDLADTETLVVDIGGGSTEIVTGRARRVEWSTSLDIGSVRLSERFLHGDPPSVQEVSECIAHLDAVLAPSVSTVGEVSSMIGVAGTVTTVAAHVLDLPSYDSRAIHGARLAVDDVRQACLSLVRMSVADRRALPFMHPGRADVIGAGALILDRLLEAVSLGEPVVTVSEHDILDGIAWEAAERA